MDTVSHASSGALTGAVVAELMLPSADISFVAIGLVAGLIPDIDFLAELKGCLLYTSPSPRDRQKSRMPSSA